MTEKFVEVIAEKLESGYHCIYCGKLSKENSRGCYHNNDYEVYHECSCLGALTSEDLTEKINVLQRKINMIEVWLDDLRQSSPGTQFIRRVKMKEDVKKIGKEYGFNIGEFTVTEI